MSDAAKQQLITGLTADLQGEFQRTDAEFAARSSTDWASQ